ncbi:MAG: serine protease, partial [Planctomycetales bacterium]|nr:serine protease [Planctomycetales bacterium]
MTNPFACNRRRRIAASSLLSLATMFLLTMCWAAQAAAQSVCLPVPRLLTTMPMGGQAGTDVEVTITGDYLEDVESLVFSHSGITARPKLNDAGQPEPNKYVVTIAADTPPGIHEARVFARLGLSAARVFTVGTLPEAMQTAATTSVSAAMPIALNSICNATVQASAVNHYSIQAEAGQRLLIDCAAKGIDSKMNPVLIIADAEGRDLLVERRGGVLDFTAPTTGSYIVKVHDLTFKGGAEYFFRLSVQTIPADSPISRLPGTRGVSSFSWPPIGYAPDAALAEAEPNNGGEAAQPITLPCEIAGRFFPAADVDTFEFTATKGEVWWVEVASERLGRPTDPSIIVQRVVEEAGETKLVDVVELTDIASPVKRSSNGYAYDGPPYNAGSTDILGKVEIPEDGRYRLQLTDLFGGTRTDPNNEYRLVIRRAAPDFALVAWALHMELRNGDRNALSKPMALRNGSTMALEVVAVRRDGFAGEISLTMEDLPDGVTATGLKIAAGETRGIMLLTAQQDAPRGWRNARLFGQATIDEEEVTRPVHLACMAWPVRDAWQEIPAPRLLSGAPVSVGGSEFAQISIAAQENKVYEAQAGTTLTIPLVHIRRGDFSGATTGLRTFGAGLDRNASFDVPLTADQSEAVLDLAKLKTPPGDYTIAFYGSPVAKHRHNPDAVLKAERELKQAQQQLDEATAESDRLAKEAAAASADQKNEIEELSRAAAENKKAAEASVAVADKRLKDATTQ